MSSVAFETRPPRMARDSAMVILQAQQFARRFVGEIDLATVSSADDIYRMVFASCGVDVSDLDPAFYPRLLPLLKPAGNASGGKMETAEDAALRRPPGASFYEMFPELKPGYKVPAR